MHKTRRKRKHKTWQLQEAKSKFSQLVDEVIEDGYQTITRNGKPVVVMISQKEFESLKVSGDSLIDFFMRSPLKDTELDLSRDKDTGRDVEL